MSFSTVRSSPIGRLKMWLHYDVFHPYVFHVLPNPMRISLYKRSRRWLYGPNANNEDLIELLERATKAASPEN